MPPGLPAVHRRAAESRDRAACRPAAPAGWPGELHHPVVDKFPRPRSAVRHRRRAAHLRAFAASARHKRRRLALAPALNLNLARAHLLNLNPHLTLSLLLEGDLRHSTAESIIER